MERLQGGDPNIPAHGFYPQYLRSDLISAFREFFYQVEELRTKFNAYDDFAKRKAIDALPLLRPVPPLRRPISPGLRRLQCGPPGATSSKRSVALLLIENDRRVILLAVRTRTGSRNRTSLPIRGDGALVRIDHLASFFPVESIVSSKPLAFPRYDPKN